MIQSSPIIHSKDPDCPNSPLWKIIQTFLASPKNMTPILNIVGPNQSGKSLLIKDFLCNFVSGATLTKIYYCDTESKFPLRLYQKDMEKCQLSHIVYKAIPNAKSLINIIQMMLQGVIKLFSGDLLIIDSLSEPLKRQLSGSESALEFKREIVEYYQQILSRLTQLVAKFKVRIIVTQHISFQPAYKSNLPFQQSVMEQIEGMWIYLTRHHDLIADNTFQDSFEMTILHNHLAIRTFNYRIQQGKIQLLPPPSPMDHTNTDDAEENDNEDEEEDIPENDEDEKEAKNPQDPDQLNEDEENQND